MTTPGTSPATTDARGRFHSRRRRFTTIHFTQRSSFSVRAGAKRARRHASVQDTSVAFHPGL